MKILCTDCARALGIKEQLSIGILTPRRCVACGHVTGPAKLWPASEAEYEQARQNGQTSRRMR